MNNSLNPLARLTSVPSGSDSSGIPSISNTMSRTPMSHVEADLAYLRSLGPGPMPWEEATANISGNAGKFPPTPILS